MSRKKVMRWLILALKLQSPKVKGAPTFPSQHAFLFYYNVTIKQMMKITVQNLIQKTA